MDRVEYSTIVWDVKVSLGEKSIKVNRKNVLYVVDMVLLRRRYNGRLRFSR